MDLANYPSLNGRAVLITDAATDIGECIARAFHDQGSRVAILDCDREAGLSFAAELGKGAHFEHGDVRDSQALRTAIRRASGTIGPIAVLVNNAARDDRHTIDEVSEQHANLPNGRRAQSAACPQNNAPNCSKNLRRLRGRRVPPRPNGARAICNPQLECSGLMRVVRVACARVSSCVRRVHCLPIGIQLVGRFRADAELLRVAALFEASSGLLGRWPPDRAMQHRPCLPPASAASGNSA